LSIFPIKRAPLVILGKIMSLIRSDIRSPPAAGSISNLVRRWRAHRLRDQYLTWSDVGGPTGCGINILLGQTLEGPQAAGSISNLVRHWRVHRLRDQYLTWSDVQVAIILFVVVLVAIIKLIIGLNSFIQILGRISDVRIWFLCIL
jgi:hypothetical protein